MLKINYDRSAVLQSISNLLKWFETVEQRDGLGGPVVHWWESTLDYCGPGMDWRLEGYLLSLLNLYEITEDDSYLKKILTYIPLFEKFSYKDGSLKVSHFQANPMNVGSPHESAAYYGLASTAVFFKRNNMYPEDVVKITKLVKNYIDNFLMRKLWNDTLKCFNDWPYSIFDIITPNKVATIINLLISAQELLKCDYSYYIRHCANWILQKQSTHGKTAGGICQTHRKYENDFFPYYNARCVIPLQKVFELTKNKKYLMCKDKIIDFIVRNKNNNFGFKRVVVDDGKDIGKPYWIAGMGDILLALLYADSNKTAKEIIETNLDIILYKQLKSGAFPSAQGFYFNKVSFMDILPVCGWNDKMLNFLTELVSLDSNEKVIIPAAEVEIERKKCFYNNKELLFEETARYIKLYDPKNKKIYYLWYKEKIFPTINKIHDFIVKGKVKVFLKHFIPKRKA